MEESKRSIRNNNNKDHTSSIRPSASVTMQRGGGSGSGGWGMPSPGLSSFHSASMSTAAVTPEAFVEMEAKQTFQNELMASTNTNTNDNARASAEPTAPSANKESIFGSYGQRPIRSHSQRSPLPPLSLHGTFNQHVMKMHHHLLQQQHQHEAEYNRAIVDPSRQSPSATPVPPNSLANQHPSATENVNSVQLLNNALSVDMQSIQKILQTPGQKLHLTLSLEDSGNAQHIGMEINDSWKTGRESNRSDTRQVGEAEKSNPGNGRSISKETAPSGRSDRRLSIPHNHAHTANLMKGHHVLQESNAEVVITDESDEDDSKIILISGVILVATVSFGMWYYHHFENWGVIDSLYFSLVTMTTVGYGDMALTTVQSKLFTCGFILLELIVGATAAGIIIAGVLEKQSASMEKRLKKTRSQNIEDNDDGEEDDDGKGWPQINWSLLSSIIIWVVLSTIGILVMIYAEDYTFVDAFYFAMVTTSTVGYGDFSPTTDNGKIFWIFWGLFAVTGFANMASSIANIPLDRRQQQLMRKALTAKINLDDVKASDRDGDGMMDEDEFLLFKLSAMGLLPPKNILDEIRNEFQRLDYDNSGKLTMEEVENSL